MSNACSLRLPDAGLVPMRDRSDDTWARLPVVRHRRPRRQGPSPLRPSIIPLEDDDVPVGCQNRAGFIDSLVGDSRLRGDGGDPAGEDEIATDDDDLQSPGLPSSCRAVCCCAAPASGAGASGASDGSMACACTVPLWLPAWSVRIPSVTYRAIRIG